MKLPGYAEKIIQILEDNGYVGYAVGGAVRDSILGMEPKDWDITTNAAPQVVQSLFPKTFATGIRHGTVTVLIDGSSVEVTTYRIDGEYRDNRHPEQVQFTSDLQEDLARRDFTINAVAYGKYGLVDPFGGITDIKNQIIRCVGDPMKRFEEDALRILRGIRFAGRLGFDIDGATLAAMKACSELLCNISGERIRTELQSILMTGKRLELLQTVTAAILPELHQTIPVAQNNPHHQYSVWEHTLKVVEQVPAVPALKFAALFHDIGKAETKTTDERGIDHFYGHGAVSVRLAEEIFERLKMDHSTRQTALKLIKIHDDEIEPEERAVRRAINRYSKEIFPLLLDLKRGDTLGQSMRFQHEKLEKIDKIRNLYQKIIEEEQALSIKDLAIDGNDLLRLGYQGEMIGKILQILLEYVLENPALNNKEKLTEILYKSIKLA